MLGVVGVLGGGWGGSDGQSELVRVWFGLFRFGSLFFVAGGKKGTGINALLVKAH